MDRLVIFVSTMEHEVLPSYAQRFALTSWLYNKRDMFLELAAEENQLRPGRQEAGEGEEGGANGEGGEPKVQGGKEAYKMMLRMALKYKLQQRDTEAAGAAGGDNEGGKGRGR